MINIKALFIQKPDHLSLSVSCRIVGRSPAIDIFIIAQRNVLRYQQIDYIHRSALNSRIHNLFTKSFILQQFLSLVQNHSE